MVSYLQFYYCALADVKPLAFAILVIWLALLFSTIGIAASDFLCINLSTLASVLGLSESLTGVTFLAFGNGSPDVFSTFAAMKSNSGGLAVGELIGAASFITSVVAGSMALVRPFRVARRSFIRDVGYFVVAVGFSMFFIADGRIQVWESAAMVGLYCFYVVMVVVWHWYLVRQRRVYDRNVAARSHFHIPDNQELEIQEAGEDDDPGVAAEPRNLRGASTTDFDVLERAGVPAWKESDEDDETRNRYLAEIRDNMHIYRPPSTRRRNTANPIRPSLVGALEFQSILSSLQKSRNIHQDPSINLNRYSDSPDSRPWRRPSDDRSVTSNLSINKQSASPSRARDESGNGTARLSVDTGAFDRDPKVSQPVHVTVSRPSGEQANLSEETPRQSPVIDQGLELTVSPPPAEPWRNRTLGEAERVQSPDLLSPSDAFRFPNYQAEGTLPRSPLQTSPRGTILTHGMPDSRSESPSSPTIPFPSAPSSMSSRAPSFSLPNASSPSDSLRAHGNPFDRGSRSREYVEGLPSWMLPSPRSLLSTLFPTLDGWKLKSIWERSLDIVAAPSVLLLTITVPVVEPTRHEGPLGEVPVVVTTADDGGGPVPPVRLPEDSPLVRAIDNSPPSDQEAIGSGRKFRHDGTPGRPRWDSELPVYQPSSDSGPSPSKERSRWLVLLQLFTGPFFISLIGWTTTDPDLTARNLLLPALCSLLFSLLCLTWLIVSTRHSRASKLPSAWRTFLALLGFVVAISWIACIATEVVNLLKTLGVVLNISDSLLGLTVFAVGNSLGDLVADITVARLGFPVMALSACFGGPMLNILLGIGLGGLYMALSATSGGSAPTGAPYEIAISKVLAISSATLLTTLVGLLIIIPLNNWRMDRKIGWGLVALWCASTLSNIIVEVLS